MIQQLKLPDSIKLSGSVLPTNVLLQKDYFTVWSVLSTSV